MPHVYFIRLQQFSDKHTERKSMLIESVVPDEASMPAFAQRILPQIKAVNMVGLRGPLGAGKTTLVRELLRAMGYSGAVKSPTYGLVESYQADNIEIAHFDLYRLSDPDELEFIGFTDYLAPGNLCLIEWPEKGGRWTENLDLTITIEPLAEGRKISLQSDL